MLTDSDTTEVTEFTGLPAHVTNGSCRLEFIEIVPLTAVADNPSVTESDDGDSSVEVREEDLPVMKQEPDDVCWYYVVYYF